MTKIISGNLDSESAKVVEAGWYGMSIPIQFCNEITKTLAKEHAIELVLRPATGLGETDFCAKGDVLVHPLVREERNRRQTLRVPCPRPTP